MPNEPRCYVFMVPEGGEILLQLPDNMTQDTFTDFQDWLKIIVRGIARRSQAATPAPEASHEQ